MEIPPELVEVGGYYDPGFPVEATDQDDEEKDLCRICRSPEEPGNPLRYPCACRGSIKYVHQNCIHLWLNRRGYKQCEVCGRNYSFVRVYSENAPERLPCHEFLKGVLVRASPYVRTFVPWVLAFLLNTYCLSLHPLGQVLAFEHQEALGVSWNSACFLNGLFYNALFVILMDLFTLVRIPIRELIVKRFPSGFHADILIQNALGHGVVSRVTRVLWVYKKILCDWYRSQLHSFFGEPPRLVGVALHGFGGIGWWLFFMDHNAFAALTISIYTSFLFVLLPFSIGWIVLATVGDSYFSYNSPVILGDMLMLSICFAYFGIFFTLRPNSRPAIIRWFSLGFHFIAVKLPCLLWVFSMAICKNLFVVVKGAFVLGLKIGVLPWMIGCWLDICTFPMSGTTVSKRIEVLSDFPFLIGIHWTLGFFCVLTAYNSMNLIQEVTRKRAFCFLLDISDPDYKITNLNLGQTLFAFASHGILLVILLHLPIKAITLISPSFFPLDFWAYEERIMPIPPSYPLLIVVGVPWLDNVIGPAIVPIVHKWIITVSSWLQLGEFLHLVPQGEGFQNVRPILLQERRLDDDPWLLVNAITEGSMVSLYGPQNAEDDIDDQRDNRFMLRLAMLLILAALTLFLVSTTFMALPILLGRAFFHYFTFIIRFKLKNDDLHAFLIGSYILRAIYTSICFVFDHIWTGRTDLLLKYVLIRIRNVFLFSIWISVIPGLLGLLIDLMIIIPLRVSVDELPIYFLIQDWLIGVAVLHMWTFVTMLTPIKCFATKAWRGKFKRIRNVGINRLPSMWLLRDVIGSIINTLLTTLCIPYLLLMLKSSFPLLGFFQSDSAAIERFIWPAVLALIAVWFLAKQTYDLIIYLHQMVFNDRYVVGERVGDLTEDLEQGLIHGV